jgi:hypothetical protein
VRRTRAANVTIRNRIFLRCTGRAAARKAAKVGAGEGGEKAKGAGRATKRPRADAAKEGPKDYFDAARASKGTKKVRRVSGNWTPGCLNCSKEGPKDYFDAARASKGTKKALAFVIPWFTSADVYLRGAPLK